MKPKNFSNKALTLLSGAFYFLAFISLAAIALGLIINSLFDVYHVAVNKELTSVSILDTISLIVIAVAVFDVGKYFLEEETLRERELRSPREARKTITKFIVIITIALILEGLVFSFETARKDITQLGYPVLLIFSATFLVIGLGVYQYLSLLTEKNDAQN